MNQRHRSTAAPLNSMVRAPEKPHQPLQKYLTGVLRPILLRRPIFGHRPNPKVKAISSGADLIYFICYFNPSFHPFIHLLSAYPGQGHEEELHMTAYLRILLVHINTVTMDTQRNLYRGLWTTELKRKSLHLRLYEVGNSWAPHVSRGISGQAVNRESMGVGISLTGPLKQQRQQRNAILAALIRQGKSISAGS